MNLPQRARGLLHRPTLLAATALAVLACGDPASTEPGPDADRRRTDAGDDAATDAGRDAGDGAPTVDPCPGGAATADGSQVHVLHHDGQSFVSWPDRAEGEAGAAFRYRVYRASAPIGSDADLARADLVAEVTNHSGQRFGTAFRPPQRLDADVPMAVLREGDPPLPPWWGVAVSTVTRPGSMDSTGAPSRSIAWTAK